MMTPKENTVVIDELKLKDFLPTRIRNSRHNNLLEVEFITCGIIIHTEKNYIELCIFNTSYFSCPSLWQIHGQQPYRCRHILGILINVFNYPFSNSECRQFSILYITAWQCHVRSFINSISFSIFLLINQKFPSNKNILVL